VSPVAWLAFVAAGAIGAPLRYVVDGAIQRRAGGAFPWGTFVVNASGSLLLGFLTGLTLYHAFPAEPRLVLGTGFCGSYTTFSTFSFETVRLLEEGAVTEALLNIVGSVAVGTIAAAIGLAIARV
jgi:CrcB protein